ncbi:MAG: hypothetical protein HZC36_06800 [Armatimonadetes bacterium]|nr:hypothetical protein [Armatimonadota bacterium]
MRRLTTIAILQIELALASPVRAFLILFLGLTFVGPVLASLLMYPLSWRQWADHETGIAFIAAYAALIVWLKKSSPWLGWLGAIGVSVQAILGLLLIYTPIGATLGFLHPDLTSPVAHYPFTAYATAWAILALACAWGMVKDDWRAYFGEIAVILVLLAAEYFGPDLSPGENHVRRPAMFPFEDAIRPYMDWLESAAYCWGLAVLFQALYRRGRKQYSMSRAIGQMQ